MITTPPETFNNRQNAENIFQSFSTFLEKYNFIKENNDFFVEEIPFIKLEKWNLSEKNLAHESGKFFKIDGIRIHTNYGDIPTWDQPIINQPEIGILGILTKVFNGVHYFLMQLKMEPGNVNLLQLSPTVQATKSNFMQVHNGKSTQFLEYFVNPKKINLLIDQLQSEQGGRFLRKRNRNMIVELDDNDIINVPENFVWLTLGEIKKCLAIENFVNMDARSVLSTIPSQETFENQEYAIQHMYFRANIIQWFNTRKVTYELETEKIPISKLNNWKIGEDSIYNSDKFFSVIAVKIETGNREISTWTQPLFKDINLGFIGLIMTKFFGEEYYLFQVKVMPGNIDIIDLSPTVSVSNYKEKNPIFLDKFKTAKPEEILFNTIQSEEGGRFYQLQTINMIIEVTVLPYLVEIPEDFVWLTKNQINKFMPYGLFNIESRSLISAII